MHTFIVATKGFNHVHYVQCCIGKLDSKPHSAQAHTVVGCGDAVAQDYDAYPTREGGRVFVRCLN